MQLLDGFYRIQFEDDRYGMKGFNLAAQREFKEDKRGLGAYAMTCPATDHRGSIWAVRHLGDSKYTIQFAEDRDGMQGFYLCASRQFKKDLRDGGARLTVQPDVPCGKTWLLTGEGQDTYKITFVEGREGMQDFSVSAARYFGADKREDGAYVKTNHPSWGASVWRLVPAAHTLRPRDVQLNNISLDLAHPRIRSVGCETVADLQFKNSTAVPQNFTFTSSKIISNSHTFSFASGFSKEVANPKVNNTGTTGSATFLVPKIGNELSATAGVQQLVELKLRGDSVTVNVKDGVSVSEEPQTPYNFPVICPPASIVNATMRVVVVDVEIPWQADEIISWPVFNIVTSGSASGTYRGVLHAQVIVEMADGANSSA